MSYPEAVLSEQVSFYHFKNQTLFPIAVFLKKHTKHRDSICFLQITLCFPLNEMLSTLRMNNNISLFQKMSRKKRKPRKNLSMLLNPNSVSNQ